MQNHLITICARGGSKGIPGKNIRKLNGKPLIGYTIEIAQKLARKIKADIALSTDSQDIKKVASEFDLCEEYHRPEELSGDTVGKIAVFRDVLSYYENLKNKRYNFIWDLDVTSPLRNLEDLTKAFHKLQNNPDAYNIFSVSEAKKNPYFNMVEETGNGFVQLVKNGNTIKSRQKAPVVYDMNASFYIYRRSFFDETFEMSITPSTLYYLMPHICFDIDEPIDFEIMQFLIRENHLGFEI